MKIEGRPLSKNVVDRRNQDVTILGKNRGVTRGGRGRLVGDPGIMPATSGKQFRLMAAIAHGAKPQGGVGPSKEVAKEFVAKTPKSKRSMFMSGKK